MITGIFYEFMPNKLQIAFYFMLEDQMIKSDNLYILKVQSKI